MRTAGRRPFWAGGTTAIAVLLASILTLGMLAGAPALASATTRATGADVATSALSPTTSTRAARTDAPRPPVSSNPIELAQTLVEAHDDGTFRTNPTLIFDREITPLAQGQALSGCTLDLRILQVLVLTLQNFGSLSVSDLQRPCIGSSLNCGPPTYSVHCLNPGEAIDFTSVGGNGLNGSNTATFDLLRYLDTFVPRGTNAGQANCRSGLSLTNINQFSDSCNHQHVDFRNTDAALNVSPLPPNLPSLADSSAYVKGLYTDFLGRTPSAEETVFWARQLAVGSPRSIVTGGFVNSDEYRLIRIDAAYRSILGRTAEDGGRMDWLKAMRAGYITTDDIETSLYDSAEYYQSHTGTDPGFVQSLYKRLLHRSTGQEDLDFWSNLIEQNGRAWVISRFWDAPETIGERVSAMYKVYLGRAPDDGGLAGWVGIALDVGDSGLRSGLTSSDEYFNRTLKRFP
ncbi:DUF4214 domain-containing protein [Subtercola boreus]|nr:DUF4214 domain-containing protein [Subtercola boreus]